MFTLTVHSFTLETKDMLTTDIHAIMKKLMNVDFFSRITGVRNLIVTPVFDTVLESTGPYFFMSDLSKLIQICGSINVNEIQLSFYATHDRIENEFNKTMQARGMQCSFASRDLKHSVYLRSDKMKYVEILEILQAFERRHR